MLKVLPLLRHGLRYDCWYGSNSMNMNNAYEFDSFKVKYQYRPIQTVKTPLTLNFSEGTVITLVKA